MATTDNTPTPVPRDPSRLQRNLSASFPESTQRSRVWSLDPLVRSKLSSAQSKIFRIPKNNEPIRVVVGDKVIEVPSDALRRHEEAMRGLREDFGLPPGFDFSEWSYDSVKGPEIPGSDESFAEIFDAYPILPSGGLYYSEGGPGELLDVAYIAVYSLLSTMNFMDWPLGTVANPDMTVGEGLLLSVKHTDYANAFIEIYDAGYAERTTYSDFDATPSSLVES